MAGAALRLDHRYDDRQVQRALRRLQQAAGNMEVALADIGEHLLLAHDQRFRDQTDPQGTPWQPLSDKYRARKKKNQDKILIGGSSVSPLLSSTLRYQVEDSGLRFGTDSIYGASHQYGDEARGIPARPYLGIAEDDQPVILQILREHLAAALRP